MNTNAPQHGHRPGSGKPDPVTEKNLTQPGTAAPAAPLRLPQKPFSGVVPPGKTAIVRGGVIMGVK